MVHCPAMVGRANASEGATGINATGARTMLDVSKKLMTGPIQALASGAMSEMPPNTGTANGIVATCATRLIANIEERASPKPNNANA